MAFKVERRDDGRNGSIRGNERTISLRVESQRMREGSPVDRSEESFKVIGKVAEDFKSDVLAIGGGVEDFNANVDGAFGRSGDTKIDTVDDVGSINQIVTRIVVRAGFLVFREPPFEGKIHSISKTLDVVKFDNEVRSRLGGR